MARINSKDKGVFERPSGSGIWWVRYTVNGKEVLLDEAVPDSDIQGMLEKGVISIDGGLCQPSLFLQ